MIRGLCVVKDEGDVIAETLQHAARFCERIYVLDNGSTDDTWEQVQELALRIDQVVAWRRSPEPFTDGIRADIFNAYAAEARPGDWWLRLDADEFVVDDPRGVLADVAPACFSVWSASLSYYFTDRDAETYRRTPELFDRSVAVTERSRYYLNHWSEPRFFRHEDGLRWHRGHGGFPRMLWRRPAAPDRILVKHFAYRSPEQIQRRLDARRNTPAFAHERTADWAQAVAAIRTVGGFRCGTPLDRDPTWEDRVVPAAALDHDTHDGTFVLNDHLMPTPPSPLGRLDLLRGEVTGLGRRAVSRVWGRSA